MFLVEIQPEEESDRETDQDPKPCEDQIDLGGLSVHLFRYGFDGRRLAAANRRVLIDNLSSAIDLANQGKQWKRRARAGNLRRIQSGVALRFLASRRTARRWRVATLAGRSVRLWGAPPLPTSRRRVLEIFRLGRGRR